MIFGGALLSAGLVLTVFVPAFALLLVLWFALGVGLSTVQTPAGRLLQRSAEPADRPAVYAAQFSLSHACWLITYPIAGLLGAAFGLDVAVSALAVVAGVATLASVLLWPSARGRSRIAARSASSQA